MTNPFILMATLVTSFLLIVGSAKSLGNEPIPVEVKNADFELGGEEVPGWTSTASRASRRIPKDTKATFKWDDSTAHSGKASIYMRNEGPASAYWSSQVTLQPNTKYRFSVWMKSFLSSAICSIEVDGRLEDSKKRWRESLEVFNTGAAEWEQFSLEFTTPENLRPNVQLRLHSRRGSGDEIWFDDVELVELTE